MGSIKQTFSNKYFDWILIGISLVFSVLEIINLVNGFEYFGTYLFSVALFIASAAAFFSLLLGKINGERFSRIFIITVLIVPGFLILNQYLTDLVFYGINQQHLLQNPMLFLKITGGIVLLYFAIQFSKQPQTERIKDYGILIIGTGVFVICYTLIRTVEPVSNSELTAYPIWKTGLKSILGIMVLIIGIRIKDQKLKFSKGVISVLITMFIFGVI
ncbi:hypothetical protein [Leadbetterella sp. DM7]|uniref:hypothetical protein n=1 Tax=Leadbetterella sp. DM7 TaxID=3235085 RepID=UPI00349EAF3D